jgi:hypothetical protein
MKSRQQIIRRMGYIRDQEGILNRYIREKKSWDLHFGKTREFINGCFSDKSIDSVAVLGSGWLLDVPLEEMKNRYKKIFLVDIHHPPQIRKKMSELEQVELMEVDLTGGAIDQIWRITRKKGSHTLETILGEITLTSPLSHINPDAVISLNLLNQLDIILCEFLEKRGYFQQDPSERLRTLIQTFHLEWITQIPGCIVTDTVEVNTDDSGNETFKSLLYTDLPDGHRTGRWSWEFDTHGAYRPGTHTRMEAQAVEWV